MEVVRNYVWDGADWVAETQSDSGGTSDVAVTNFPATQPVSGSVAVSNLPATQPVSGNVAVTNFPATQPISGAVSVSNLPATQPVSAAALPLPAGAATEASLGTDGAGESPANGTGIRGWLRSIFDKLNAGLGRTWTLASGTDGVTVSGTVGVNNFPATQPVSGTVGVSGGVNTGVQATSGGATVTRIISAASTNATSVKASSGRLYFGYFSNNSAAAKYIKFYNKASAPTVGTDTPVLTVILPVGSTYKLDFNSIGLYFATGIAVAITGAFADSDTTNTAVADVIAQIYTF